MSGEESSGTDSQAELQRRFLRAFCWLCVGMGSVAILVAWLVMGLTPHLHSPWVLVGLAASYGSAAWVLVGSREQFHPRYPMLLLGVIEIALIAMLTTMRPTETALGVLSYLTLPMLFAGFLLPPWMIWLTACINILAIGAFIYTADEAAAALARMSAARALVVQVTAAAMLWFFATRIAELIRHQSRQLSERELLLKEIHHRVKNNLQVVSSLLGLQSRRSENEEVRSTIEQSRRRILAIATAHEAVYQDLNLGLVSLPRYFDDLISSAKQVSVGSSISITTDIAPIEMGMEHAVPLGLVLNELLMNSFKHAFSDREGGSIHVTLTHDDDHFRLCVADDGIGFSSDQIQPKVSLGIALVRTLATQLGAELHLASEQGTRGELVVPCTT